MQRTLIYTLGATTAEHSLATIRNGTSEILRYFDDMEERDPVDDKATYRTRPPNEREISLRPVRLIRRDHQINIVPTRSGVVQNKGGGCVDDREAYMHEAEGIIALGLCRTHRDNLTYGSVIVPSRVRLSPTLGAMLPAGYAETYPYGGFGVHFGNHHFMTWGEEHRVCYDQTLTVHTIADGDDYEATNPDLAKYYAAREMELGWVLGRAAEIGRPAMGALVVSDTPQDHAVDAAFFHHALSDDVNAAVDRLLATAVTFLLKE